MPRTLPFLAIAAALTLAACSSEAKRQADEYTIMRRSNANSVELCEKAKAIAKLYAEEENDRQFERWDQIAYVHCLDVELGIM
ncbi:hypothetical protein [Croceicoccus gelatinilyticus]|uniref:hypothetical protein n=1 Tax=Croceicoccus gelatinilyticus TaxID=2835536 RepID=UPI001BCE7767|nr:hypothetical protein [Croceicoccus gelatinilyticus]MBS7670018.1 hypothetical protein [Croceicoccus gelatinilyticus]